MSFDEENVETQFKAGIDAFSRIGMPHLGGILLSGNLGSNLTDIQKNIGRSVQDPVERFVLIIVAIIQNLPDLPGLNQEILVPMLENVRNIRDLQYKNHTAFILGYYVSDGGKRINKRKVDRVFQVLNQLHDDSVKPPDIIRYARFWMTL